ncbi:MAG: ankyrin repeat domain-containing protein [Flavobacteriaceae bacterium]
MKKLFVITALFFGVMLYAAPGTSNNELSTEKTFVSGVDTFCKLIQQGNYDAVKSMIEASVDVNKKSVGKTPLMYAARHNKVEILKLLLANGAEMKTKCDRGYTALDYAKLSKAVDAEMFLLAVSKEQSI